MSAIDGLTEQETRLCRACGEPFPLSEFARRTKEDGVDVIKRSRKCKACVYATRATYKIEHRRSARLDPIFREKENARARERRRAINADPILRAKKHAKHKEDYARRRDFWRDRATQSSLRIKSEKAGRRPPACCECCGEPLRGGRGTNWDHDHETGKFRGWICNGCNCALGYARDSIETLQKLENYLRNPPGPTTKP